MQRQQMTASFEETYRRYPFAPLVTGALRLAAVLMRWRQRHAEGDTPGPGTAGAASRA